MAVLQRLRRVKCWWRCRVASRIARFEDIYEPGLLAFHAEHFVHDAALYKPHLQNAAGGADIHVGKPEALVVGAVCVVQRVAIG